MDKNYVKDEIMSYSLYAPLRRIPQHIEEVREIVQTFLLYNEEILIKYHFDNKPKAIIGNVIYIKYKNEDCFLYFYDSVCEITGSKEFDYGLEIMAINSKVSLPTVLAYSFCDENYIIFNDDGLLGESEMLTKQELYNKIKERYFLDPIFRENYLIFI